jgi:hypothetical protein
LAQALIFFFRAIAPIHVFGLAKGYHVGYPGNQACVLDVAGGVEV